MSNFDSLVIPDIDLYEDMLMIGVCEGVASYSFYDSFLEARDRQNNEHEEGGKNE